MSVFKKHRGKRITPKDKNWSKGTWYVWKRVEGRIVHKAIKGAQTKADAEAAEREIIRDAFNRKYGLVQGRSFEDFANGTYTRYFESVNTNVSAKRLYVRTLVSAFKGKTLDAITPQDCRDLQTKLRKTLSASSVNLIMSTASKIFNLAGEEGILDKNPMQWVKRMKEPPARDRILSKDERERLWAQVEKDSLLFPLVTLAINLPLRRGQLLAITPDAIDLENGSLLVIGSKGREPIASRRGVRERHRAVAGAALLCCRIERYRHLACLRYNGNTQLSYRIVIQTRRVLHAGERNSRHRSIGKLH